MTQPPYEPGPVEPRPLDSGPVEPGSVESARPQDIPHDPTRGFPTYGRPQPPPAQPQYGQGSWQPPYGPGQYGQPQYPPQYGQAPAPYGQPAAYGYGYGYGQAPSGTNALATAALVCGLGGIVFGLSAPVAVGLGIAALVQIGRRPQGGKGMAIAGIVVGALVTLGYALLIGLVIAIGTSDSSSGAPDPGSSSVYIDELDIGDCFDDTSSDDEVTPRDCPDRHDAEMVAIVSLPAGAYPGDNAIEKAADRACAPPFGAYVGKSRDESELYLSWWTPDKYTWNSGDRRVFCVAYGPDNDKLVGTVKNSHR